jgi:hypothetical protein
VFLLMNDVETDSSEDDLTNLALGVAAGRITKSEVAVFLQKHAAGRSSHGLSKASARRRLDPDADPR